MPNTSSAKKAHRQSLRRRVHNRGQKTELREAVKKFTKALAAGKADAARSEIAMVYKKLDKAAKNHLIGKNTASRLKSRLTTRLNRAGKQ